MFLEKKLMTKKFNTRFIFSLVLMFSIFAVSLPNIGYAQTAAAQTKVSDDLQARLKTIEEKVEKRRSELGIPGMSLVIVQDGKIIYAKGFGYKDFEKQIPVTTDTQFAIGSATKAFTALSVLMSADEGKVSLDDNPKKYLPYFTMKDAETAEKITVRDLLSHSSGLSRTDLAMITDKLKRDELIKVAGEAKPVAKLREKFGYQNVMFAAAGEIVAQTQKTTWEKFVPERIFKPLGMNNSTMTIPQYQKAKDISFGYNYNFDTKETIRLPFRPIDATNPAGSINSSANDMAKWLNFVLGGGSINGKRLVSEKGFEEWMKPQMKISPDGKVSYGLGWFLQDWNGLKVVQHGGNIDGFNSMVAMIPEKKLGFVMLTNVSGSSLGGELMPLVWDGILSEIKSDESIKLSPQAMEKLVGKYKLEAAGIDIEVKTEGENLVMIVPGQPAYTLQRTGERQFKLVGAPDGFAVKFSPAQGNAAEMFLQQPQGNFTLPRIDADGNVIKTAAAPNSNPAKELIGKYQTEKGDVSIEIKETDGKVSFVFPGQSPYEMQEREKDLYRTLPLPDVFAIKVNRDASGKPAGLTMIQPQGNVEIKLVNANDKPKITTDELLSKTIAALGGEAAWKKINSRETKFEIDFENQGVKGSGTSYAKFPNITGTDTNLIALGKPIGTVFEYFDGTNGGQTASFAPSEIYTGQRLEDVKYENDFYGLLNWKNNLKSAQVTGIGKVGEEDVYVVKFTPEKASEYTYFISQKTFLPLKKTSVLVSSTSSQKLPITQIFSDYRAIDGVMIPFKTVAASPSMGDVVTYLKEVKHNVAIDDAKFKPRK